MILTPVPLARFLRFWGLGIWAVLAAAGIAVAFLVEKKKKEFNIQTFREIASFLEGKRLDEIEAAKEEGKRPYQKTILVFAVGAIALVVEVILFFVLK